MVKRRLKMVKRFLHPGVYVVETSIQQQSVIPVATAIPAFIGYTQNDSWNGTSLVNKPKRISSLTEFSQIFGSAPLTTFTNNNNPSGGIDIQMDGSGKFVLSALLKDPFDNLKFRMFYSLQVFFANGGGPCYIVSCGSYENG
jgi:phage tail sheath protein FI